MSWNKNRVRGTHVYFWRAHRGNSTKAPHRWSLSVCPFRIHKSPEKVISVNWWLPIDKSFCFPKPFHHRRRGLPRTIHQNPVVKQQPHGQTRTKPLRFGRVVPCVGPTARLQDIVENRRDSISILAGGGGGGGGYHCGFFRRRLSQQQRSSFHQRVLDERPVGSIIPRLKGTVPPLQQGGAVLEKLKNVRHKRGNGHIPVAATTTTDVVVVAAITVIVVVVVFAARVMARSSTVAAVFAACGGAVPAQRVDAHAAREDDVRRAASWREGPPSAMCRCGA